MNCIHCNAEFQASRKNARFCQKSCYRTWSTRKWRAANPEKNSLSARRWSLKFKYGISLQDYDLMFSKQEGKCKICNQTSDRSLDVDHCHDTGKVRGLLCNQCNQAIGLLKEDTMIVKSAYMYLREAA